MAWLMPTLLALLLGTTGLSDQFHQALEASRQGRFDEALSLWDGVIERAPADSAAWSNRGNVRLALGDPEGAISDQSEAIRLEPEAIDPHLNRGTAEEALALWDQAAADYNWILERQGFFSGAAIEMGVDRLGL